MNDYQEERVLSVGGDQRQTDRDPGRLSQGQRDLWQPPEARDGRHEQGVRCGAAETAPT